MVSVAASIHGKAFSQCEAPWLRGTQDHWQQNSAVTALVRPNMQNVSVTTSPFDV